jgi:hypothetical protein
MKKYFRNSTSRGTDHYAVEYVWNEDHYDIYNTARPSNPYSSDPHKTHLYTSTNEVCVAAGKEPKTVQEADRVARAFIDHYSTYVRDGRGRA